MAWNADARGEATLIDEIKAGVAGVGKMQAAVESEEEAYPVGNTNGENSMLSADALKSSPIEAKEGISMIEALKSGWHGTPAALAKEVLLGIIICMAQIPESIAFAYMAHVRVNKLATALARTHRCSHLSSLALLRWLTGLPLFPLLCSRCSRRLPFTLHGWWA